MMGLVLELIKMVVQVQIELIGTSMNRHCQKMTSEIQ